MNYNLHTHTYRCHHASETPEEYVLRAIECGVKYFGFSDHVPLKFHDGTQSGHRVYVEEAKAYCDEIKALAEKYSDKIEIHVGFEAEFYPEYIDEMINNVIDWGAEYLILGPHFTAPENEPGNQHSIKDTDSPVALKNFVNMVISGMSEGVFTYVAHPDMFNFQGDEAVYEREITRLCQAGKNYNMPFELNFLGIRDRRVYPNVKFWEIAGRCGVPVTFGFDSHDAMAAYDGQSLVTALEMVEKFKLNYIGRAPLVKLEKRNYC